jgi:hypothetical protein
MGRWDKKIKDKEGGFSVRSKEGVKTDIIDYKYGKHEGVVHKEGKKEIFSARHKDKK